MSTDLSAHWSPPGDAQRVAAATYDAAADHYDLPPLGFWARHGRSAVARLGLEPGAAVLDVGCGSGASAIPAAEAVGESGSVLGIDLSEKMLARARRKSADRNNLRFVRGDMARTGFGNGRFDAVISCFSLFFVDDMAGLLEELWRLLRPGGKLLVATWGPDAFEPGAGIFRAALARIDGTRDRQVNPWQRICRAQDLHGLFHQAGLPQPEILPVADRQPLHGPEDWWTIVMGSGFRRDVERLPPRQRQALRASVISGSEGLTSVDSSALHAQVTRPGVYSSSTS